MRFDTDFKRAWLEQVYDNAVTASLTLIVALKAQRSTHFTASSSGRTIASTTGNGHSVSFSSPGPLVATPADMLALCGEMLRLYTDARNDLINDDEIASPTDAQIVERMLEFLLPVSAYESDFAAIRT